ncbi:MAG: DoxX family protein [Flavobacteriaceae bacterium]|nr:DoxX family protein [Flavobacteriaceae bacterium]
MVKLFLRIAIAVGFLSAVADRLGYWPKESSTWGTWDSFLEYTQSMIPFLPSSITSVLGLAATILEIVFALALLVGYKTELFAKLSGFLLILFGLAMTFSFGIKPPLDYSVFAAAAAAFALSTIKEKRFELDTALNK